MNNEATFCALSENLCALAESLCAAMANAMVVAHGKFSATHMRINVFRDMVYSFGTENREFLYCDGVSKADYFEKYNEFSDRFLDRITEILTISPEITNDADTMAGEFYQIFVTEFKIVST